MAAGSERITEEIINAEYQAVYHYILWGERVWQKGEVTDTAAMDEAFSAGKNL